MKITMAPVSFVEQIYRVKPLAKIPHDKDVAGAWAVRSGFLLGRRTLPQQA